MDDKKKTTKLVLPQIAKLPKVAPKAPQSLFTNIFFWMLLALGFYLVANSFMATNQEKPEKPITEVLKLVGEEKIQDVSVSGDKLEILLKDGTQFVSKKETGLSFDELLKNNGLSVSKIAGKVMVVTPISWEQILSTGISVLFPIILLVFLFRQFRTAGGGDMLSFGRARAKLFNKETSVKTTFSDVAGNKEAKQELVEIVDFLKNPDKYYKLGARIPKGVLLVGPSGVGKTLLAKAVAGEADVPFFSASGSEFMEMLVGVGSARVRDLFARARASQPSLIFIDEIDAIGRQRGMGFSGGHDEREQTLNQILAEMDGFDPRTNVLVLGATNRGDMLDPALIRAGRFDRRIVVPLPDLADRKEIINLYTKNKPMVPDFNAEKLAKKTVGFSGADIENMMNEAAILAARAEKTDISNKDLDEASLKVTMGSERKTMQTETERKTTAFHEAGHALVATFSKDMDPVQRISIVARGASLGHTSLPPDRDRYGETKTRLLSFIATMLGGRAAEEIMFDDVTTGASDDLDKATKLAREMVTQYGMSSLGLVSYGAKSMFGIWKNPFEDEAKYSQEIMSKIDTEVKKIVDECFELSKKTLSAHKEQLEAVANKLLEVETLDGDEFRTLL
ncbi:MAG: ATP-dependent zinc metalloprotease FtsH [Patescibacteria group bacterium]